MKNLSGVKKTNTHNRIKYASIAAFLIVLSLAVSIMPAQAVVPTVTEYNPFPTPSASCSPTQAPPNYCFPRNKQNESPMAVNPTNSSNIITGANDESEEPFCTPATGGSSNCPFASLVDVSGVYVTGNSGTTWHNQILHWVSTLGLESDGDPVVAFGPKLTGGVFSFGTAPHKSARAYFGSLAGCRCNSQELLAVANSDDNGTTWSAPVLATTRTNPVDFNDKIAIWVDANPSSPFFGNVYVSWTLFIGNPTGNFGENFAFSPEPIMLARSTDGGLTFSKPVQLTQASNNNAVGGRQGSVIRTGPDGAVYVLWDGAFTMKSAILGAKSTDGGVSFSNPFLVAFKNDVPSPFPGASFRTNSFPMADIDQNSGNIFVVWTDYTSGHAVAKMVISSNGGNTWTGPPYLTVADVKGRSAFYPAVAVKPDDGLQVFVGFNTITDKTAGTAPGVGVVTTQAYFVIVDNTGSHLAGPTPIPGSGDPDASSTNGLTAQFIGDYDGASASSIAGWFSWTDSRNGVACSNLDTWRADTSTTKPNIYDKCSANFGNTDIFVAQVTWT